jgi:hypothetical protein
MEANPYKATVNLSEYKTKVTERRPRHISNLAGFVLFLALIIGQPAVILLLMCADDIFHPIETWPSEIKAFAIAGLIGVVISLSLIWLTKWIEQGKKASSIARNVKIADSE